MGNDRNFRLQFATAISIGYLLATIPQTVIDPFLLSHVRYGARYYNGFWLVFPILFVLVCLTMIVVEKTRPFVATVPFILAIVVSVPIFRPEVPHGNLFNVGIIWALISSFWYWIHTRFARNPVLDPLGCNPALLVEAVKEEATMVRSLLLGLVAAYFGVLVVAIKELHAFNTTMVSADSEVFLLQMYSDLMMGFLSAFFFLGPVMELMKKQVALMDNVRMIVRFGTNHQD